MMEQLNKRLKDCIRDLKKNELAEYLDGEAHRLYDLIQKYLDAYYDSYLPKEYERTNHLKDSLRIKQSGTKWTIYFEPSLAYHPSIMKGKGKRFVPSMIDSGWQWKSAKQPIYRFTYYDGYHFIEQAIEEFQKGCKYPINIKVESSYNADYYQTL